MNSEFTKLGRWLSWTLWIFLGLLAFESVAGLAVMGALSGPADADLTGMQQSATGSGLLIMGYASYAQIAAWVAIIVLFLVLLYKGAKRAKGFAKPFTYVSPGWAVGYWFIPIMNLYRPYQVVKALFAACAEELGPTVKPAAGEQLLSAWWGMLLISSVAARMFASSDSDFTTRPGISTFAEYSIGCNLLLIIATLLFAMVVKRLVQTLSSASLPATLPGGAVTAAQLQA